jgi:hypothetical protein
MRKFLFLFFVLSLIASPFSFAYFNPDSEEYSLEFEGATKDDYETTLAITDPTADRTVTIPNATGTVSLIESAETFSGVKTFSADPLVTGTTPLLTIGDGGDEDAGIQFNSDTTDYYVSSENALDALILGTGSAIGTTPAITIVGQAVTLASTLAVTGNTTLTGSISTASSARAAILSIIPAASTAVASGATAGHIKIINDAAAADLCSTVASASSGGTNQVVCISNGTNWVALT